MAVESVLRPRSATVSVHDVAGSRKETQIKIAREEFQQFGGNATGLLGPGVGDIELPGGLYTLRQWGGNTDMQAHTRLLASAGATSSAATS